ncbi:MAG: tyrosine--tRNA ligase [Bacteroidetes bacterium]|nr:MAG: tyrosine--tRNA ligase [Bacteroidota bacterium]TAG94305.1 MAG: tyrosine--tRNA ligase [Bacteroidota bacterium]
MIQKNYVDELRKRGLLSQVIPNTEEYLNTNITAGYVGFDPTAVSLHIGSLLPIMLLVHFQRAGHKPIALVGGATGMIGDPSGKSKERNLLSEELLQQNVAGIKKQLEKFLDFESKENPAEIVNNYDWTKNFSFLEFLRDIGKYLSVNYMMAKDSVKNRLEGENGISFTEFSYQLLQGFDFLHLYENKNCKIQMGGSDQWGNITTGTELISKKANGKAYAIVCPLMTKADGTKFGKSEGGNIWLDATLTSPYQFYQFWLKVNDADLPKLFRFYTLFEVEEIEKMELEHQNNPNALKKILADDITARVHSQEDVENAQKASVLLFKGTQEDFENTDEKTLKEILADVPQKIFTQQEFEMFETNVDWLSNLLDTSKGDIKKLIKGGGISINREKITEQQAQNKPNFKAIKNKYFLIKKGKEYFLTEIK